MTSKNKKVFAVSILILALTILGCNIPTATLLGNQPGAAYTQAAQTIVAQLTYSVVETFIAQKTQEANLALTPQFQRLLQPKRLLPRIRQLPYLQFHRKPRSHRQPHQGLSHVIGHST